MSKLGNEFIYQLVMEELSDRRHLLENVAGLCLCDRNRTITLMDIVSDNTSPDMTAVDLGAGTGILGFAFLNAGGSNLYSVEIDKRLAVFMQRMSEKLGFQSRMDIFCEDALGFKPPGALDMVICEMIGTGLAVEDEVAAMRNIRKYCHKGTLFLPETASSAFQISGESYPMSEKVTYDIVDFRTIEGKRVMKLSDVRVNRDGFARYARLSTKLGFPNGSETGNFGYLCPEKNVQLRLFPRGTRIGFFPDEAVFLREGHDLTVQVYYEYGAPKPPPIFRAYY